MKTLLIWAARIAGALGVAAIALAFAARINGSYWIAGLQVGTVLQAGIAAAVVGCLAYLAALVESRR
jgi:hypothetical protein